VSDRIVAVVPVKRLDRAKGRLASRLGPAERRALVLRLLDRVLGAIARSGVAVQCVVVSPDWPVLARAAAAGATPLAQHGIGLNPALEQARRMAAGVGATGLLVVFGDLPLLTEHDLRSMAELGADGPCLVLAPDRRERGTNAFLVRPADGLPFRSGPGSYQRYTREAQARGLPLRVYRAPGTAFDLDWPEDLDALEDVNLPGAEERSGTSA
jgi:2-phospho-L-lactate guanylyltransferase